MDWNQSTMYEQRVRFILEVQQRTFSFAESCRRYSISRAAGYKWWTRFLAEGFEGLHDRSHRPHHCPHAVAEGVVEHVVDLRQRYGWGSRKIRKLTAEKFGEAPARRTIDRIFERHDLITKKRRRSGKPGHPGKPLTPMDEPNAVWTVDFKGQFKMFNGRYCYPLTIQDGFSRFLLECRGLYSTSIELAKPVFIKVFREFGVPAVIRSDNGTPFASIGLARLTRLSAWWIRLGIRPETIEPGKPQQNGRHERMHRTLKREATRRRRPTSVPSSATSTNSAIPSITSGRTRLSTMRLPTQSINLPLEPTPTSSHLSRTLSTSRSERSLQTEGSAGTRVGSTSVRLWATSSSPSNPSVPLCGRSTSDPLPSGGLTKNSSSFSTPTATQEETQSVNHQPTPLCQPSGALFTCALRERSIFSPHDRTSRRLQRLHLPLVLRGLGPSRVGSPPRSGGGGCGRPMETVRNPRRGPAGGDAGRGPAVPPGAVGANAGSAAPKRC